MTNTRKGAKTQRLSIRVGGTLTWIIFTLLSALGGSLFTLPAFAQQRTTEESANSSGRQFEDKVFGRRASSTKPNIITIITDDQGWADIGYNNPKVYTPNLDALAAESAVCTRHYSMPQCTPTRIAAFTGRYPGRFGNAGLSASNEPAFPHGTLNLATFLKANGYKTYLSGKWHMGVAEAHGPHHHGFDSSYGSFAGAVGYYDHRYRQRYPEHEITWHRDGKIIEGYENGVHVTDLVSDEAIRIIKKHAKTSNDQKISEQDPADDGAKTRSSGETERNEIDSRQAAPQGGDRGGASMQASSPFFLYLAYHAPHTPLDERGEFVDTPTQLDPDNPKRWLNEDKISWFNDPMGIIQSEQDPEKRLYLAVLHHLDDGIGRVLKALDESGQRDNTLILFTSDNGPQVNWPGNAYPDDLKLTDFNPPHPFRGSKCHAYEGGVRVPGLVHWRGKIPARKVDSPVHVVDWMKTIGGFIGIEPEAPEGQPAIDGQNNSALYLTKADPPTRLIYQLWGKPGQRWALILDKWKIVHYGKKEPRQTDWELYDLNQDPKESKNLAQKYPDKIIQLHQLFLTERAKDRKTKSNL